MAGGEQTPKEWYGEDFKADFYLLKGVLELIAPFTFSSLRTGNPVFVPGVSAEIQFRGETLGVVGEIHPEILRRWGVRGKVCAFEFDWDRWLAMTGGATPTYQEISKFPFIDRDMAIIVEEKLEASSVVQAIQESGENWIQSVRLFDVYRGNNIPNGKKSLAFSICYEDKTKTLTESEIDLVHQHLIQNLSRQFDAKLRS